MGFVVLIVNDVWTGHDKWTAVMAILTQYKVGTRT